MPQAEVIHDHPDMTVYLSRSNAMGQPVILKVVGLEYRASKRASLLANEFEILTSLDLKGVSKPLQLGHVQGRPALAIEYFESTTIKQRIESNPFTVANFLPVGIELCEILAGIHASNVIHRDISSTNILIDANEQVQIIDFNLATRLSLKSVQLDASAFLEGNLAYISPEQTGRIHRYVDHRSDLYSLGVVLYEMLAGRVPFVATDPLELIYAHIAFQPEMLNVLNAEIPAPVAAIVAKLLAKNAEDRYQSALGLKADLELCHTKLASSGSINEFELGTHDFSGKFRIPERLYGRDQELATLLNCFDEVAVGGAQMVQITGRAGTGKSSLVHEINKPIASKRGFFLSGKFDQFTTNKPYSGIRQALSHFVDLLLMEPKQVLAQWRTDLLEALGGLGKVLTDVVPELEAVIGQQADVPAVGLTEAQNRFNYVFLSLIRTITSSDRPLVLFVDDLQWADPASLHLLKAMMLDQDLTHLLFLGSYRHNEVTLGHPLAVAVSELESNGKSVATIALDNLPLPEVQALLAEALNVDAAAVADLAQLVFGKTRGNPFFLRQFMRSLYERDLLEFNFDRKQWMWSDEAIRALNITDNVLELLETEVRQLSATTQELLKSAALIGDAFDVDTLATITQQSSDDVFAGLRDALARDLLMEVSGGYKFIHDRIRQAVDALIPEAEKARAHVAIGRLLLKQDPAPAQANDLFTVMNHLNQAIELAEGEERQQWSSLNRQAGQKALDAAAFNAAQQYFEFAIALAGTAGWENNYAQQLIAHNGAAEAAFMSADYQQMNRWIDALLAHGQNATDTVKAHVIRIKAFQAQGKLLESVQLGLAALKSLGVRFPAKPNNGHIILGLLKTKQQLKGKSADDILGLPPMSDANSLAVTDIMANLVAASYLSLPNLLPLLFFKQIALSLTHGNAADSATAYVGYGTILCALGDFDGGNVYGEIAMRLVEQPGSEKFRCKIIYGANALVVPWKRNVSEVLEPLSQAYHFGLESGDHENTAYAIVSRYSYMYVAGINIDKIARELSSYLSSLEQMQFDNPINFARIHLQLLHNLQGNNENPVAFDGPHYDEAAMVPQHIDKNDANILGLLYAHKLILAVRFRQFDVAAQAVDQLRTYAKGLTANPLLTSVHTYTALALLNNHGPDTDLSKRKALSQVRKNLGKLRKWAKAAPENVQHKYELVEAERLRVLGKHSQAGEHYQRAVELAVANGFPNEEALALELQARWMQEQGSADAGSTMRKAVEVTQQWGATALVRALKSEFPEWTSDMDKSQRKSHEQLTQATLSVDPSMLDLETILKASNAISEQITLNGLLERLMAIAMENAGAQTGQLLMEEGNEWRVMAAGQARDGKIHTRLPAADGDGEAMAQSVVNYVSRTLKPVVIEDAVNDDVYWNDPYIQRTQPKSILCSPFLKQGKLVGIVYLENNISNAAFGPERLQLLNMLSSQAAISIENARLYTNMEALVEAYERFVPKQFLKFLHKESITEVQLGNQVQKEMTIMFSDIRNFTSLSERMTPQENFNFLNLYLSRMEPVIGKYNGFIDKYIGDAIMGLFPTQADDALQCAIEMLRTLNDFNSEQDETVRIGIGLNTGNLMLGTIGGAHRMDGTVISDAVNITSRVEAMTKSYGASLIITESTYRGLKDPSAYLIRRLDNVIAKGKTKSVMLYQVCDFLSEEERELVRLGRSQFELGVELFHDADFDGALELFTALSTANPKDRPAAFFAKRCQQYLSLEK